MATNQLTKINQSGQSIWMDNLSSNMMKLGGIRGLVQNQGSLGITSNSAIFAKANLGNAIDDADIAAAIRARLLTSKIYKSLTFADIHNTCDVLCPVFELRSKLGRWSDRHIDGKIDAKLKKGICVIAPSQRWQALVDALIGQNTVNTLLLPTVAAIDHGDVDSLKNPNTNINKLLIAGINKFLQPYQSLMNSLKGKVKLLLPALSFNFQLTKKRVPRVITVHNSTSSTKNFYG